MSIKNGYFYISDARKIIFDTLNLQSINDEITANLHTKMQKQDFATKRITFISMVQILTTLL